MTASPFSSTIPNFQVVFDSTSLGWLKTCPAYYKYQMIDGWRPKLRGIHLTFGALYATGSETYAKERAKGRDHDTATRNMVRRVLMEAGTRSCTSQCTSCDGSGWHKVFDGSAQGHGSVKEPCENSTWTPWEPPADHPDASIKNRYTLIRSLVWNVEDRLGSPFQVLTLANGKAAAELSFEFPAFTIGGEQISLSGHMDSVVQNKYDKTTWVSDDKTTKGALNAQYFRQYTPNNQMSLYSIAGKIVLDKPVQGVLVRAAQILVGGTRFVTQQVPRTPQVLEEWMEDAKYWVSQAKVFAETNRWPKNDKSCSNYGGCPFSQVCARIPSHRAAWLREDYVSFKWNPAESRGD